VLICCFCARLEAQSKDLLALSSLRPARMSLFLRSGEPSGPLSIYFSLFTSCKLLHPSIFRFRSMFVPSLLRSENLCFELSFSLFLLWLVQGDLFIGSCAIRRACSFSFAVWVSGW
jgi:hypothetical protein